MGNDLGVTGRISMDTSTLHWCILYRIMPMVRGNLFSYRKPTYATAQSLVPVLVLHCFDFCC